MLVTVNKPCHAPHASRITSCRKIFTEIFYCVSKKIIRSVYKTFASPSKTLRRRRKRKKKRKAIAKRFALHADAKNCLYFTKNT